MKIKRLDYKDGSRWTLSVSDVTVSDLSRVLENDEFCSQQNKNYVNKCYIGRSGGYNPGKEWYGGFTKTAEAGEILANGWKEGADKVRKFQRELEDKVPKARSRRRRLKWAEDGDDLDPDRALNGQWDTAFRIGHRPVSTGPSIIEIVVSWGGNCDKSSEQMFWSGAASATIADLLENAGYAVRIIAASCTGAGYYGSEGHIIMNRAIVKDSNEALRIDALAGILCHAGVYRTTGFGMICSAPFDVGDGLGYHVDFKDCRDRFAKVNEWPTGAIEIDSCYDRNTAVTAVKKAIEMVEKLDAAKNAT